MPDRDSLRAAVADVLDAMRRGDDEQTKEQVTALMEMGEPTARAAVWELAKANSVVMRATADPAWDGRPVAVELCDPDGSPIDIDRCPPALRASVRILLAMVHHEDQDARAQLDIVSGQGIGELALVFLHLAAWTLALVELLEEAEDVREAGQAQAHTLLPDWLRHLSRHS